MQAGELNAGNIGKENTHKPGELLQKREHSSVSGSFYFSGEEGINGEGGIKTRNVNGSTVIGPPLK